jgi:hypothetical protein
MNDEPFRRGQVDVEEDDVGLLRARELDGLVTIHPEDRLKLVAAQPDLQQIA